MTRLVSILLLAGSTALAYRAEVTEKAPLMVNEAGQVSNVAVIPAGETVEVIGESPKGGYLHVKWNGKKGWVVGTRVRVGRRRAPASQETKESEPGAPASDKISISGSGAFRSGQIGVGLGGLAFYRLPMDGKLRWDVGPGVFFFPAAGTELTGNIMVFEFMALGRVLYPFRPDMEIGAQLGALYSYFNYAVSPAVSSLGVDSVDASSFGVTFAGLYSWQFSPRFRLLAGLHLLLTGGTATMVSAGVEFRL